jgi:hypothetical protein
MRRCVRLRGLLAFCLLLCGCAGQGLNTDWDLCSDDFSYPTIDTTTWAEARGAVISDGWLMLDGAPGGGDQVLSHAAFHSGHRLKLSAKAAQWAQGTSVGFEGWLEYYGASYSIAFTQDALSITAGTREWHGAISPPLERGRAYLIEIRWFADKVELLIDDQVKSTYDNTGGLLPEPSLNLPVILKASSQFADQLSIDYVNVYGM